MRIILDFDHTLFDMQRMHQELISALDRIGIPEKMYKEAYSLETHWKVFTVQGFANRLASKSGIAQEIIEKTLWDVAKSSGHCLYPDVMEVCRELKSVGHTLILLSWGDEDWQGAKIEQSGVRSFFDEIVTITDLKADYLKGRGNGRPVVLVDDKPAELKSVQEARPDIQLVRMRRPNAKYSDTPTPDGMTEVTSMRELQAHLRNSSS